MNTAVSTQEAEIDQAATALIGEHVRQLLQTMGIVDVKVSCRQAEESQLNILIEAGDVGRILIGTQGSHLFALQHVVRCLLRKQLAVGTRVEVDVNGYRARRERTLLGFAEEAARKAHRTGRTVVLQPMTASDRRIIHTALSGNKDIATESLGNEPDRRVVVRPIFL